MASSERRSRSLCGAQPPAPLSAPLAIAQHPVRKHPRRGRSEPEWGLGGIVPRSVWVAAGAFPTAAIPSHPIIQLPLLFALDPRPDEDPGVLPGLWRLVMQLRF